MDVLKKIDQMFNEAMANAKYKTFGERLSSIRSEKGLKQIDIANATNLNSSIINRIESDKLKDIKLSTAMKLAEAYCISLSEIINGLMYDLDLSEVQKKLRETKSK